jgi:UDP-N-acetylmuramyl-tripeptide synthetase
MNISKAIRIFKLNRSILNKNNKISKKIQNLEIQDIMQDSRLIKKNDCYFCFAKDVKLIDKYISDAINNGAIMIVANFNDCQDLSNKLVDKFGDKVVMVKYINVLRLMMLFIKKIYYPLPRNMYAVTGTNGKTSTVDFIRQICCNNNIYSASIGTLGTIISDNHPEKDKIESELLKSGLTTPEVNIVYKNLATLKKYNINNVAIEASSIGIEQGRLADIRFRIVIFTNFSQDHLDYHGNLESYFKAKLQIFLTRSLELKFAVINCDLKEYERIAECAKANSFNIVNFGYDAVGIKNNIQINLITNTNKGQKVLVTAMSNNIEFETKILGNFQIYNMIGALIAVSIFNSFSKKLFLENIPNLSNLKPIIGRMEFVANVNKAKIFIDYAHTPDALEKSIDLLIDYRKNIKATKNIKIIIVFGCGGNRDAQKRPLMGKIAVDKADIVIVTDDNPRNENAGEIRKDIISGCSTSDKLIEIPNRKNAIIEAIKMLKESDILLIAGKGHEKYQIIGNRSYKFDEREIVAKAIKDMSKSKSNVLS